MKKSFLVVFLFFGLAAHSQYDERFGLTAGVNQYYMNADFLSSRSGTGFSVGVVSTIDISEYSEILADVTYSQFNVDLLGRKEALAQPEWKKFKTERVNVTFLYDYDILHFLDEDLAIGIGAGPSFAFITNFQPVKDDGTAFLIDPYGIDTEYMKIDENNSKVSFNVFAAVGVTVRYRNTEAGLRYYKGMTDTYRNFPAVSSQINFTGKDNYSAFTLTYYFGDNF